jgi:poly(3-hydroxybutyrate) depolymerase
MLYHWYELGQATMAPMRATAMAGGLALTHPFNPLAQFGFGRQAAATLDLFERATRAYGKPAFNITETRVDGAPVRVRERIVSRRAFVDLVAFDRDIDTARADRDPNILIVAPLSGHHATLVAGAVEALLPAHNVFVTDWRNARDVPASDGAFGLDDYIDDVRAMIEHFQGDAHVFAVCQPGVAVLAAVALLEMDASPAVPKSVILAGSPIDTRINPTFVNAFAEARPIAWYRDNVISEVPRPYAGAGRLVYPGFLQLTGFVGMNLERHLEAHRQLLGHLIEGNDDGIARHHSFYDNYLAVMDLPAAFYLDTIERVFLAHELPKGCFTHRGRRIDLARIRRCGLMTIEGEKDDITGVGQCRAAQALCPNVAGTRAQTVVPGVGHFGIFSGSRFRALVAPEIARFVRSNDPAHEEATDFSSYNRDAALSAARGESLTIDPTRYDPVADTDAAPDPIAARLERAGVGLLGDPRHRAQPGDVDFFTQGMKLWQFAVELTVDSWFGFAEARRLSRSTSPSSRSHTTVEKPPQIGGPDTNDAMRQRRVRSQQQQAN